MTDCKRLSRLMFSLVFASALFMGLGAVPDDASAQIRIGFCQGQPGSFGTYSVSFLICCPGDSVSTRVTASTGLIPCDDAAGVMTAMNAAVAGMMFGGSPIFGPAAPVAGPVAGQARFDYPLSPAFAASGCCIVGGNVTFDCGTMSLRINPPCDKKGDPGGGGRATKLCVDFAPPPIPTTLGIMFEGCPLILVEFDGTETLDEALGKILAALGGAGYTAFINSDGKIEVTEDCDGDLPTGVDEFGLVGGLPMPLGIEICPTPDPTVGVEIESWGSIKSKYQN